MTDPIVQEVRRVREEMAAKFNFDVRAIVRHLQKEQKRSGRKFVRLPSKKVLVSSRNS